jgi:hypothetical protein
VEGRKPCSASPPAGKAENLKRHVTTIRDSVCMLPNDRIVSNVDQHRGVMAITWRVLHPERLILATAKAQVTAADLLYCMDELTKAGLHTYRKIFDFTLIAQVMPRAEVQLIGERTSAIPDGDPFGPMAIVVASNAVAGSVRTYEQATALKRPVQVFRDFPSARAWLDERAPPDQILQLDED